MLALHASQLICARKHLLCRFFLTKLRVDQSELIVSAQIVCIEFDSALKYGALGTLLRKVGRLLDDERARYAERRYELTRTAAEILLGGWA